MLILKKRVSFKAVLPMMAASQFNSAIQINYPGTGNNSQFTYDGFSHLVRIVETSSGTATSTKPFVLDRETMQESRDGSSVHIMCSDT